MCPAVHCILFSLVFLSILSPILTATLPSSLPFHFPSTLPHYFQLLLSPCVPFLSPHLQPPKKRYRPIMRSAIIEQRRRRPVHVPTPAHINSFLMCTHNYRSKRNIRPRHPRVRTEIGWLEEGGWREKQKGKEGKERCLRWRVTLHIVPHAYA